MEMRLPSFLVRSKRARVFGDELAGDEVGEVADLRQDLTERADDKAGHVPRVVSVRLCLDGPGCVHGCAEFRTKLPGGLVVVPVHLAGVLLDGRTDYR